MSRTRPSRAIAGLAVAVALLGGCTGDDDGAGPTTTTATTVTTTEPTVGPDGAGCEPARAAEAGVVEATMEVDGQERSYRVAVPASYDGTEPVPVVFTFHGLGSNDAEQLAYSRWGAVGDAEGFLTVAPLGLGDVPRWDFLTAASTPGSDSAFIDALVDEVAATYCADERRLFANGISNGSAVTFGLACRHETPFAAYGGVAATFYAPAVCGEAPPTSIVYFHGTADGVVPYDGGEVSVLPGTTAPSAPEAMAGWAEHDGCAAEPETSEPAPDIRLRHWTGCDGGSEVAFYTVEGGGHSWPGSIPVERLGETTASVDATEVMWEFFEAHPLPE